MIFQNLFRTLDILFSNTRHAFHKSDLGYDLESKKLVRKYAKTTFHNSCKFGHSSVICKLKQYPLKTNKK